MKSEPKPVARTRHKPAVIPAIDVLDELDRFVRDADEYGELVRGLKLEVEKNSKQVLRTNYQDEE